jgi:hypothetical protein
MINAETRGMTDKYCNHVIIGVKTLVEVLILQLVETEARVWPTLTTSKLFY